MTTYYRWNEQNLYLDSIEVDETGDLPIRSTATPPPEPEEGKFIVWSGSDWLLSDTPPPDPRDWPALIAARRWIAQNAGTVISGHAIETNAESRGLITGAAVEALMDPEYTLAWKVDGVFVRFNAEQIKSIASAVRAYVQACFDREEALLAAVSDGSITAELLEQGWPA